MLRRLAPTLTLLLFALLISWSAFVKDRTAKVAEQFYPGSAAAIKQQLQAYFAATTSEAEIDKNADLFGIIVPHAGGVYSGKAATIGFSAINSVIKLNSAKLLQRPDSSQASGKKSNVVGYAAVLMQGSKKALKKSRNKAQEDFYS
jgi:predicted class III extradiol MEMO1 family dioxygenase